MTTDNLTKRIARILNDEGWTFEGVHEPGDYDECEDCRRVVDPIAARIAREVAGEVRTYPATQEPTEAEVEAAAIKLCATGRNETIWQSLDPEERDSFRADARAALSAARKASKNGG